MDSEVTDQLGEVIVDKETARASYVVYSLFYVICSMFYVLCICFVTLLCVFFSS